MVGRASFLIWSVGAPLRSTGRSPRATVFMFLIGPAVEAARAGLVGQKEKTHHKPVADPFSQQYRSFCAWPDYTLSATQDRYVRLRSRAGPEKKRQLTISLIMHPEPPWLVITTDCP